jgi:hypothetical protein
MPQCLFPVNRLIRPAANRSYAPSLQVIGPHQFLRLPIVKYLLAQPAGDQVAVVVIPSYLDFGHFLKKGWAELSNLW